MRFSQQKFSLVVDRIAQGLKERQSIDLRPKECAWLPARPHASSLDSHWVSCDSYLFKRHLDVAIPLRSALTTFQITHAGTASAKPAMTAIRTAAHSTVPWTFFKINFTVEDASEIKRVKTGPVAQARFHTSPPGRTLCEKKRGFVRCLSFQASPRLRNRTAICNHCLANHNRTEMW